LDFAIRFWKLDARGLRLEASYATVAAPEARASDATVPALEAKPTDSAPRGGLLQASLAACFHQFVFNNHRFHPSRNERLFNYPEVQSLAAGGQFWVRALLPVRGAEGGFSG
jgi:hypothetical protein